MAVLWDDLLAAIPRLRDGGVDILDAGGGAGHLAIRLAQLGHRVVLAEPARDRRDRAQAAIGTTSMSGSVIVVPGALQELPDQLHLRFDVIVCHAILEWLAEPLHRPRAHLDLPVRDGLPANFVADGGGSAAVLGALEHVCYRLTGGARRPFALKGTG
jgi:SAM-dependent methyltransferase